MRKAIWKLSACIAIVLLSFAVSSCGDDDEEIGSRADLIGMWEITHVKGSGISEGEKVNEDADMNNMRYEFKEDGTLVWYEKSGSSWYVDEQLQYEYKSGGQLYLRESDGTPFEDDFEKYSMKVVKLTESTLVIEEYFKEDSDNEIRANYTFKRIS